jgi:hypothetical protein
MDILKPKPWRGWPEFVKEIGTIVIGVLIALSAEAVAEKVHEGRLSDEARAAVRSEINLDLSNMKRRAELEPCITRRLADLSDFVARAEAGEAVAPPLTIGAPGHPIAFTERWDAATAGGRTSLLSLEEQQSYARAYAQIKGYQASKPAEREVWGDLVALEGVRRPSPELLAQARLAIGRARLLDMNVQRTFYETGVFAGRIGIKGDAPITLAQPYLNQAICMPLSTPPDVAARAADRGMVLTP